MQYRYFPCLADIYQPQVTGQDEVTQEIFTEYEPVKSVECAFRSISPERFTEKFGREYQNKELILVEILPKDAPDVDLECRLMSLRHKTQHIYYYPDCIFEVDGINPVVDWRGKPVAVQLFCSMRAEKRAMPEAPPSEEFGQ